MNFIIFEFGSYRRVLLVSDRLHNIGLVAFTNEDGGQTTADALAAYNAIVSSGPGSGETLSFPEIHLAVNHAVQNGIVMSSSGCFNIMDETWYDYAFADYDIFFFDEVIF